MASDSEYTWYIHPADAHTNQVISEQITGENANCDMVTVEGKKNLWLCPSFEFIKELWNSRHTLKITFTVFSKRGGGRISNATLLFKSKKRRLPATLRKKLSKPKAV